MNGIRMAITREQAIELLALGYLDKSVERLFERVDASGGSCLVPQEKLLLSGLSDRPSIPLYEDDSIYRGPLQDNELTTINEKFDRVGGMHNIESLRVDGYYATRLYSENRMPTEYWMHTYCLDRNAIEQIAGMSWKQAQSRTRTLRGGGQQR